MPLLSIREYARQRGVSHVAVLKHIRAGKIPTVDGKIDPEAADAAWGRNRSVQQPSKLAEAAQRSEQKVSAATPVALDSEPSATRRRGRSDIAHELYNEAKARKEAARAKRYELELRVLQGELVPSAEVRDKVSAMLEAFKSRLLPLGDELGDKLAATSDPVLCRQLIDERVRHALSALSEWPANVV